MALTENQYNLYINTHLKLLYFIGFRASFYAPDFSYRDFKELHFKDKMRCRDFLLSNLELVNEYLELNFDRLSSKEIQVIEGFKKHINRNFIILKSLKKYSILLDTESNLFYAVKPLKDNFKELLGKLPAVIETAILPFEDLIIYDGFIRPSTVRLASNIVKDIRLYYKVQKDKNKIIHKIE